MSIACWQDEYCTKNEKIDQEHQALFQIVDGLHNAMLRQEPPSVLKAILENLATHTWAHFQTEENLMQIRHYPGYRRHKQVHDRLKTKVTHLLQNIEQPAPAITTDVTSFLTEWLVHHIKGEDQKMIQFFRKTLNGQAVGEELKSYCHR